ncbi:MAG TPA: flavodoxin domain-containing protein [Candidatus Dojkabacteria bacterium]|nr:flavodoxin domain-containing protein [Candidatus Dojkabacteria bacterium]HRO64866.1 flavodoxin domain-containing protein [Candidatus Dojkabacteria bacterium]HRP36782.1 flavodoxin domain-containing protein [Candidatus Dojkabacteria bacterium]HRP51774.1 flavodoxin domain-containing protein [Candidatus Dojkabacteria bacterium]
MSKILVSFATMSGNTERVAQYINSELPKISPETQVSLVNMMELTEELFNEHDLNILGSSTWTDGEFNPISEEFFNRFSASTIDLNGIKFAIFGLGESYYPEFCTVVEKMENVIKSKNGLIVTESLKLDGYVDDNMLHSVGEWLNQFVNTI